MFYVAVHLCAGVVQYDVGEDAGVVGCVVASVLQAGVDFGRTFATAGEGSASVDDDAAPVRRGSVVAVRLKGDGSRSCAFGENLSAAVHEDVLVETLLGEDGRTGVDGERAAYYDRTGERIDLVGGPVLRRAGLNGVAFDRFGRLCAERGCRQQGCAHQQRTLAGEAAQLYSFFHTLKN